MVDTLTGGLRLAAGVVLLWTALRSRTHWGEPGAKPFTALTATLGTSGLALAAATLDPAARVVIERGHENPLEHGSGLGLWAIKWGVTRIGGHLSIHDNEPRGTVLDIRLPGPEPAAASAERESAVSSVEGSVSAGPVSGTADAPPSADAASTGDADSQR